MEIFADALLVLLLVGLIATLLFMWLSITTELESRLLKAQQISPIINGQISKSFWQSRSAQALIEATIIKGKWQNYDVKLILDPNFFQLHILFPKLKKRGFWFVSFPKVIDNNIVWEGRYLYSTLRYDDFFCEAGFLLEDKFYIVLNQLEQQANKLITTK